MTAELIQYKGEMFVSIETLRQKCVEIVEQFNVTYMSEVTQQFGDNEQAQLYANMIRSGVVTGVFGVSEYLDTVEVQATRGKQDGN